MVRFGYKASAEQFGPRQLLEYAVRAEEHGFDSVFVSDHLQPWRHDGGHAPAALPWLGALVARTRRIVVGTSVLTPTFRYHPAVVAQAFATLGCLAPGRVVLGVGSGESLNEAPLGAPWPPPAQRLARLTEAVELIRRLWREDRVDFAGRFYRTDRATVYDRPEQPVPLYVAGGGPVAARLAGRLGDGFICTSGKGRDLYADRLLPAVAEGATGAGRDPDALDLTVEVKVSFDTDPDRALRDTAHWAALALTPEEKTGVDDPIEMQRRSDALPLARAASRWIVSADPAEHAARVQEYLDLGFRHLVFHAPGPDQAQFLSLYSTKVLPLLSVPDPR
ncbi:glucose-6-phosphate dehydrogenase (coenzyme-F420) [Micromonospora sp. WMMA2032]|uniref:glucose-6-phosphate dehydrogenase (coenzyme-F420) n=1 Tax=Micromonospora sp. WMMA2032 TaxID=2039870 RepID=UPI000C05A056|nr:glucose-6-phosphate dehydrogenase (coenzyme-F420) [Micromonospora sp. WMMA2032]ATO12661.1 glucose-6-phosphate dehydrogenase (coenzyme-F420) [Micromonospora sp. WMMA2032]